MSKFLVIVESPAKSKTIKKILGADYKIIASYGHIMDLPKSKLGVDTEHGFNVEYEPSKGKNQAIKQIKTEAALAEKIFLCSDPDREGEQIANNILSLLSKTDRAKAVRATFNQITQKAVREAIANPRQIDQNLVAAQQARRVLDRIVGYKISPLLWDKIKRGLSAGRVQSVAVRLIAEREKEIQVFVPEEYWSINGSFSSEGSGIKADLKLIDENKVVSSADELEKSKQSANFIRIDNQQKADDISKQISSKKTFVISKNETKQVKQTAYPPFHTSSLQMSSANRLGFDAKRTMQIAQSLYEGIDTGNGPIGLITYMRTDSFNVSREAQGECRDVVLQKFGADYLPDKPNFYRSKAGAQEAHECIRPTHVELTPEEARSHLTPDLYKLYMMIWQRFVASQMSPALYDSTTIDIQSEEKEPYFTFRATGRKTRFAGWTAVYKSEDEEEPPLPQFKKDDKFSLLELLPSKHMTQPPPRFTDASLVKTLEKEGIGRPSTYASIIQTIQDRKYVEKNGRGGKAPFKATDLGMTVTDRLIEGFPTIMDLGFTRDMEKDLDDIESGTKNYLNVMTDFYGPFVQTLKDAKKKMTSTKGGEKTNEDCPKCGEKLTKFLGSCGYFMKCTNEKCGHSQNLDGSTSKSQREETPYICDKCGAKVVKATGRFGPYFCCENYHDKKCNFTMKMDKKGLPKRKLEATPTNIPCPKCKAKMVIRVASRKKQPNAFLSCSKFPKCRESSPLPDSLEKEGNDLLCKFKVLQKKDREDAEKIPSLDFSPIRLESLSQNGEKTMHERKRH